MSKFTIVLYVEDPDAHHVLQTGNKIMTLLETTPLFLKDIAVYNGWEDCAPVRTALQDETYND